MPLMYVLLEHFLAKQINKVSADIEYIALHIIVADFSVGLSLLNSIFLMNFAPKKQRNVFIPMIIGFYCYLWTCSILYDSVFLVGFECTCNRWSGSKKNYWHQYEYEFSIITEKFLWCSVFLVKLQRNKRVILEK